MDQEQACVPTMDSNYFPLREGSEMWGGRLLCCCICLGGNDFGFHLKYSLSTRLSAEAPCLYRSFLFLFRVESPLPGVSPWRTPVLIF